MGEDAPPDVLSDANHRLRGTGTCPLVAKPRGQRVVGVENNTSFIRAVRSGRLHANARPVTRGRMSQVWEVWIRDEKEQLVAQGRVRLLCVDEERALG